MKIQMKKIFLAAFCVALVFSLVACKEKVLSYEVFTVGSSLSASGTEYKVEKDIHEVAKKTDSSRPQTASLTINGKTITGTYSHSEKRFPDNFYQHIYYGKSTTNKMCFDDSGKLVKLIWPEMAKEYDTETTKELTEEECLAIAKDFILNMFSDKVNLDEYTVNSVEGTSQEYKFEFKKYITGFATADKTRITVLKDGTVYLYNSTMFDKISANDMPTLDQDKLVQVAEKKLDSIYQDTKGKHDTVIYGKPEFYLTLLEDGNPVLYCTVSVRFEDGKGGSFSEMVSMIIT